MIQRLASSFVVQLFVLLAGVVLLAGFVASFAIYRMAVQRQYHRVRTELMRVAQTAAKLVDGDEFDQLQEPVQQDSAAFRTVQERLQRFQEGNSDIRFIYTMRRTSDGKLIFVVDTPARDLNGNGRIDRDEEMARLGRIYAEAGPAMVEGFARPAADSAVIRDQWGLTLSGYAPIHNRAGQSVGLVGVDMAAAQIDEMAASFRQQCLTVSVAVLLAALAVCWWLSWRLSRPLTRLLAGIRAVGDGHLDAQVPAVYRSQEFRELSRAFNEMVAKRREMEELLHQSAKLEAVGQLASGVAHDFNNLLTPIVVYSDLLLRDLPKDSEPREFAHHINRSAHHAAALVRQLLAFSRRDATRSEAVDVHQVVAEVTGLLSRTIEAQHKLVTELHAGRPVVVGDPRHFASALLNLVLNARDAMPKGGTIAITTEMLAATADGIERLRVTVRDTGVGMDEATRQKLFQPFFTTKAHGTGLGLVTVRNLIDRQGAAMRVESVPGEGTAFIMDFPCPPQAAAPPTSETPAPT